METAGSEDPDGCCVPAGLLEEDVCASEGAGTGEDGPADVLVSGVFVGFTFGVEDGFGVGAFVSSGDRVPSGVSLGSADGDAEADGTKSS